MLRGTIYINVILQKLPRNDTHVHIIVIFSLFERLGAGEPSSDKLCFFLPSCWRWVTPHAVALPSSTFPEKGRCSSLKSTFFLLSSMLPLHPQGGISLALLPKPKRAAHPPGAPV